MLISSLNRDMTEKRCLVKIGDRLENLLPVSEYNALNEKRSILVSNLPKKRIFRPSPERPDSPTFAATFATSAETETSTTAATAAGPLTTPSSTSTNSCNEQQQQQQQGQKLMNNDARTREESFRNADADVAKTTERSSTATNDGVRKNDIDNDGDDDKKQKNSCRVENKSLFASGDVPKKMKHRLWSSSSSTDNNEKVTTLSDVVKDERRVAPIIIKTSKFMTSTSTEKDVSSIGGGAVQVEKIEVIRLPLHKSRSHDISSNDTTSNDASSNDVSTSDDAEPRPRVSSKKLKLKNAENSGDKLKKKKRKRHQLKFYNIIFFADMVLLCSVAIIKSFLTENTLLWIQPVASHIMGVTIVN